MDAKVAELDNKRRKMESECVRPPSAAAAPAAVISRGGCLLVGFWVGSIGWRRKTQGRGDGVEEAVVVECGKEMIGWYCWY